MKNANTLKNFMGMAITALFLTAGTVNAQSKPDVSVVKDCCMMKDGKMMQLKDGKLTPIKKPVVLADGTKIKRSGKVIKADGTKIRMKEGNCMDNSGKLDDCAVMDKPKKTT